MIVKLAVLAGTVLAPLVLVMMIAKASRKREERYRQWERPLIGLAFTVVCCVFFSRLSWAVDWLLSQPFMAAVSQWIQQVCSASLIYGAKLYSAFILNVGVLIGYLLFKYGYWGAFSLGRLILRFFRWLFSRPEEQQKKKGEKLTDQQLPQDLKKLKGPARWYWELLNLFYHIDDRSGLVRSHWLAVCKAGLIGLSLVGAVYLLLLAFAQLPILASFSWYPYGLMSQCMDSCYLWPAISAVGALEFLLFLHGKEQYDRFQPLQAAKEPQQEAPVDYSPLQDWFRQQFPDRYIASLKVLNYPSRQEEVSPKTELAQHIYDRLIDWSKENKRGLNKAMLDCVANLANGENTLIDAQFSGCFSECLLLYMNGLLARGENLLILCRDEESCRELQRYVIKTLGRINGLMPVWIVRSVQEAYEHGDCDVLVLPPDALLDDAVKNAQQAFFRGLTTVLIVDVSRLLAEMGTLLMAVASQLRADAGREPQYIALCDGIPGEMRITLEQTLSPGREFRAYECFSSNETTRIMLWNYEPCGEGRVITAQSQLFHQAMDRVYLGVAVPLACAALKKDVESVCVMGGRIPSAQLLDSMRLHFSQMSAFFGFSLSSDALPARLLFRELSCSNPFVVVLDDLYNLPMTIRNNCRYIGRDCAMIHIVSKPYLLRDYFMAHAADYLLDKSKMEMFASFLRDSAKTAVRSLILEASQNRWVSEERIMAVLRGMGLAPASLRDALETCYAIVCNGEKPQAIENAFAVRNQSSFRRADNTFVYQRYVTLKDASLLSRLTGEIMPALLRIGGEEIRLGIPGSDIYRYYLPDQAIVVNGHMYYIDGMDGQQGVLHAGQKVESLALAVDYFQHRRYSLKTDRMRSERRVRQEIHLGASAERYAEQYEVELLRGVEIGVETLGYLAPHPSYPRLDLTSRAGYHALNEQVQADARRTLSNGSAIALRFMGVEAQKADALAVTMAVLLSELMKTLFPYNWPCIAVCPVLRGPVNDAGEDVPFQHLAMVYSQVSCPQSWPMPQDTAEILIIEDSRKDLGVLDTLFRNRQQPMSAALSMLLDYLEWQHAFEPKEGDNIRNDYLQFGGDTVPGYFDLRFAEGVLRQLEVTHPISATEDPSIKSNLCYFCRRNLLVTDFIVLRDEYGKLDRKVCTDCAKRLINDDKELMKLFEQAKAYLHDTFHVSLPKETHAKFASAAAIRKQLDRNRRHGRVIGLAQSLTKTVWAERNSPKEYILSTLIHELTHIWQFTSIQCDDLKAKEGHASLMEVRYLHDLGYTQLEQRMDADLRARTNDEYGAGYVALTEAMKNRPDGDPFAYMLETYPKKK